MSERIPNKGTSIGEIIDPEVLERVRAAVANNGNDALPQKIDDTQPTPSETVDTNPESENLLVEQWADDLFDKRLIPEVDAEIRRQKKAWIADGNKPEDFSRTVWTRYRQVLEANGIIPSDSATHIAPGIVREVVRGAHQKEAALREYKTTIAQALVNDPARLELILQGIDNDRAGYKEGNNGSIGGWDKRIAAEAELHPILAELAEPSAYSSRLNLSDYTGILAIAQSIRVAPENPEQPENPSLTILEQRWMDLVGRYGESNGNAQLREQVSRAYDKLQQMRDSTETRTKLESELREVVQLYGAQMDKSSPKARELTAKATAIFRELEGLKKWQDDGPQGTDHDKKNYGSPLDDSDLDLPRDPLSPLDDSDLDLPRDPLSPLDDSDLDLPRDPLSDDPVLDALRDAYVKSLSKEDKAAIRNYLESKERKSATPIADIFAKAAEEQTAEETNRCRAEVAVMEDQNGELYGERLETALRNYAELKATTETRGFIIGRAKREAQLKVLEGELFAAKLAFEKAVIEKKHGANLYLGDEAQIKAQEKNDLLTAIRELDVETRKATNAVLDKREQDGGWIRKAAIVVGNWLRSGNKVEKWLKAGGAGAGVVLLPSVTGLGWPITSVVAVGAGLAVRSSVKTAALDQIRKTENRDGNGMAKATLEDSYYEKFMQTSHENKAGATVEDFAGALANRIFTESRERGYRQVDKANKDVKAVMIKYGVGAIAAGAAKIGWDLASQNVSAVQVKTPEVQTPEVQTRGTLPLQPDSKVGFEWPQDASRITKGEGWFSQFRDMGMTSEQARALFNDDGVMQQLKQAGAAYIDKSPKAGGWGINMPASGHLSKESMNIIGEAMKARGLK